MTDSKLFDIRNPERITPRECIGNAREALNKAYGWIGKDPLPLIMEAVDWQRRALEQMIDA